MIRYCAWSGVDFLQYCTLNRIRTIVASLQLSQVKSIGYTASSLVIRCLSFHSFLFSPTRFSLDQRWRLSANESTHRYPSRSKSKRKTLFRGLRQPRVTIETGSHIYICIEEASTAPFTIIYWPPVLCHKGAHTDIVCEDLLISHQHNADTIAQSVHPKW